VYESIGTLPSIISFRAGSLPLLVKNLDMPLPDWFLCLSNNNIPFVQLFLQIASLIAPF
jgi:hypothetical protein